MTTPTTPAADEVSLRFRKKPVVIEASQWLKNGDHPLDYSRTHQGLENGQLRDFQPQERQANAWEGDIVRYYRTPSLDGKQACKHCGKIMHEHGWIDTLEGGHIVCPGDWIITGVAGEHYPCKPDIFAKTYEPAELAAARESALIAERDALLIAGGDLANCAYNLAQRSGEVLSARLVAAPQGLPPHFPHEADRETGEGLEPAYSVSKLHEYAERYALEALEAQAASVEPVGKIINSGGNTGSLPEHPLLVWLGGVPPVGTELYASAPPSPANVPGAVEPLTKDDIDKLAEVLEVTSLDEVEPETVYAFTRAIEARFAPQPQAVVASSPAQAVDAVDELREALRGLLASGGVIADASPDELQAALSDPESEPIVKTQAAAVLRARAALQAARQPQAQQGGGDLSIYKARWRFALAASDDWTYAVCKWDGADWLPIKTEDDLRIFDAALATKESK